MTADPALLTRTERDRLRERPAEVGELARLMCQPGSLPEPPEPLPLHRAGRDIATERTTSS